MKICVPFTNFSSFSPVPSFSRYFSCFASTKMVVQSSLYTRIHNELYERQKAFLKENCWLSKWLSLWDSWFELVYIKLRGVFCYSEAKWLRNSSFAIEYAGNEPFVIALILVQIASRENWSRSKDIYFTIFVKIYQIFLFNRPYA